jgi:hypothetical protein
MYALGLPVALLTGVNDPGLLFLETMGGLALAAPALFMVVLSTTTSDFPDVYSATCSLLNISRRFDPRDAGRRAALLGLFPPGGPLGRGFRPFGSDLLKISTNTSTWSLIAVVESVSMCRLHLQ